MVKVEGCATDDSFVTRTARLVLATSVALVLTTAVSGAIVAASPPSGTTTTSETTVEVRTGDSLVGLANRYGVRLSALLRANSMTLSSVIHPGDTVVIPAGAVTPVPTPSRLSSGSSTPAPQTAVATTESTYVVKSGDALASIAWRNGVKLGAILEANNLTITSLILPGQMLALPAATMPIPASRSSSRSASAGTPTETSTATPTTPAPASSSLEAVLNFARAQEGVGYRFFSAGPDAFDCSGLVVASFRQAGVSLPHQSRALATRGTAVDWTTESIAPGDLVFTSVVNDPALITHVGIALSASSWIHAVGVGRTVSIGNIPSNDRIMAVRRIALP